jgi:short-subunit dehydrogenase
MPRDWDVAIITGASSGIGWELAKELARRGTKVGLIARRREQLAALADEIGKVGGTAAIAPCDIADREAVIRSVHELEAALGPTNLLIANAGVGAPTVVDPVMNTADMEKMFRVNVFGVLYTIEAVLPGMLARRKGHLAAVSSLAAYKGLPGESGYSSTKAAVNNLMEGLRIQLRPRGIYVTTICPGFIATPMTAKNKFDMPFLMGPEKAAKMIVNAIETKRKVYDFPWQMSLLMRLLQFLPDWITRRGMAKYNEDPPFPDAPL